GGSLTDCRAPKLAAELSLAKFPVAAPSSKFTRLKTLKNAARNSSAARSVNRKFLDSPMSQLLEPGKRKLPFPMLPKVLAAFGANEAGFSQSRQGPVMPAFAQAPVPYGSPIKFARS